MKKVAKPETALHRIMVAPFLRFLDWMSGREVPGKRPVRTRN